MFTFRENVYYSTIVSPDHTVILKIETEDECMSLTVSCTNLQHNLCSLVRLNKSDVLLFSFLLQHPHLYCSYIDVDDTFQLDNDANWLGIWKKDPRFGGRYCRIPFHLIERLSPLIKEAERIMCDE